MPAMRFSIPGHVAIVRLQIAIVAAQMIGILVEWTTLKVPQCPTGPAYGATL